MTQLSANALPAAIRTYVYDRNAVQSGIVHFGVGNFHRAHQAIYCEDLLERGGCDAKASEFKRYGSARQLYNFNIDNAY